MKFIKYQVMQETNVGTDDDPQIEKTLMARCLGPMSEASFEANYALAVSEAWNGEVTVEDLGEDESAEDLEGRLLETALDHEIRLSSLELGV